MTKAFRNFSHLFFWAPHVILIFIAHFGDGWSGLALIPVYMFAPVSLVLSLWTERQYKGKKILGEPHKQDGETNWARVIVVAIIAIPIGLYTIPFLWIYISGLISTLL